MISGVLLLDKPSGITSNLALQKVKRFFNAKKAGHTGSLDPLASGMLPITLGEATKFSQYLLAEDKTYEVCFKLGERTNTSDAEGVVIQTHAIPSLTVMQIQSVLHTFLGETQQIPTMFSAIKYQGQPLYTYARKGIVIDRAPRPIRIDTIDHIAYTTPFVQCRVRCSKGTYIRTLVDDAGEKLGCGAHVTALRRLSVGEFLSSQMMTMEALFAEKNPEKLLLPVDAAVLHLPPCYLSAAAIQALWHGKIVPLSDLTPPGLVRMYTEQRQFIGVGERKADSVIAVRLIQQCD